LSLSSESGDRAPRESPAASPAASSTPFEVRRGLEWRTRRFLGTDGREWHVREAPPPSYDRRGGPCLVFEAVDIARRVRVYPAHWFDCSDAELIALCEGTVRSGTTAAFKDRD
jgi:hypothetical protein